MLSNEKLLLSLWTQNCYYNMKIINNEKEKIRLFNWYSWHCELPWWLRQAVGKKSACSARIWVRFLGWEDPLEKGTATHSCILAWRIPWTEEPGGLQSMGSQRVGHDWVTFTLNFHLTLQGFGEGGIYQRGALHPEMSPLPSAWDQSWKINRRGSVSLHL